MLFVLADTDRSEVAMEVLRLHRGLATLGAQMRTVALGPGRLGGLDHLLPVLSPATRSLGAAFQLRREQRWADVVVCWGVTVAALQRLGGSRRRSTTVIGHRPEVPSRSLVRSIAVRGATPGPPAFEPMAWAEFLGEVSEL